MSNDKNESLLLEAINLHKQGKLQEAKEFFYEYLKSNSEDVNILLIYAQLLVSLEEFKSAIDVYISVLNITKEENFDIIYKISLLYSYLNNDNKALEYAERAFNIKNNDLNLILHISSLYKKLNVPDKERYYIKMALEINPEDEFLHLKLAIMYKSVMNLKEAIFHYVECLKINPDNIIALCGFALCLIKAEQYDLAYEKISRAYEIDPNYLSVYNALFLLNMETRGYSDAIEAAQKMIELEPSNNLGYCCLGQVYYEAVDYKMALDCYDKGLELKPNDLDCLYNRACCLKKLDFYNEAIEETEKIIAIYPDYLPAQKLLSFIYLEQRQYEQAMQTYFFLVSPYVMAKLDNPQKLPENKFSEYYKKHLENENLENKTLLIYNNAGAGDFIMFSRYIKYFEGKNINIIMEADKNFAELFRNSFSTIKVVEETKETISENYDYSASVMALLYNTKLDFDSIPCPEGWLKCDENLVKKISQYEIFNTQKKKIGVFWRGNKKILKNRYIELQDLLPIFELDEKYAFYSLDIEKKDEETLSFMKEHNIIDCSKYISTLHDTAAILKNLDLILTIDSSICHLSGGLGLNTYLMLPENTEWRWFHDDKKTDWYNSVSIFKQKKQTQWQPVIEEIKQSLINRL